MFSLEFSFISGFMLGFELVSTNDLLDSEFNADYLVIDLFIIRLLFTYHKE